MKIIILIVLISLYSSFCYTQDIYLTKGMMLANSNLKISDYKNTKIENFNYDFSGFLVIKINKQDRALKDQIYYTTIYWTKNVFDSINNNVWWYEPAVKIWAAGVPKPNSIQSSINLAELYGFANTYFNMNEALDLNSKSYLFTKEDKMQSDNLINSNFLLQKENDSSIYAIYTTSFITAVLINEKTDKHFFIPLSSLRYLEPLSEPELRKYGFYKSKIKIKEN